MFKRLRKLVVFSAWVYIACSCGRRSIHGGDAGTTSDIGVNQKDVDSDILSAPQNIDDIAFETKAGSDGSSATGDQHTEDLDLGEDLDILKDTGSSATAAETKEGIDVADFDLGSDAEVLPQDATVYASVAGKAPIVDIHPWPPPCDDPHTYGDSNKGSAPNCWAPPTMWCSKPANQNLEPACSKDGKYCCLFPVACFPCDWVSCFGCPGVPDCPPQCKAQPDFGEQSDQWTTPECVQFGKILTSKDCALCGADVYCK